MNITPLCKQGESGYIGTGKRQIIPAVSGIVHFEAPFKNSRGGRGRGSPRTHLYSVLMGVATLLHPHDCIGAWDGQRGHRGEDGDRLAGYEVSHERANREDQVQGLQRGNSLNIARGWICACTSKVGSTD